LIHLVCLNSNVFHFELNIGRTVPKIDLGSEHDIKQGAGEIREKLAITEPD